MSALAEIAAGLCLLVGGAFALIAGIGVLRMPGVFNRLHASTKAGTLGVGLIVAALALVTDDARVASKALGAVVFLLATAPIGAHLIGRAAAPVGYGPHAPPPGSAPTPDLKEEES